MKQKRKGVDEQLELNLDKKMKIFSEVSILEIPDDCWYIIATYFNTRDWHNLILTSKKINTIFMLPEILKEIYWNIETTILWKIASTQEYKDKLGYETFFSNKNYVDCKLEYLSKNEMHPLIESNMERMNITKHFVSHYFTKNSCIFDNISHLNIVDSFLNIRPIEKLRVLRCINSKIQFNIYNNPPAFPNLEELIITPESINLSDKSKGDIFKFICSIPKVTIHHKLRVKNPLKKVDLWETNTYDTFKLIKMLLNVENICLTLDSHYLYMTLEFDSIGGDFSGDFYMGNVGVKNHWSWRELDKLSLLDVREFKVGPNRKISNKEFLLWTTLDKNFKTTKDKYISKWLCNDLK
jgi:hypothetical protein